MSYIGEVNDESLNLNNKFYYKISQEFKYLYDEWGDITDQQDEKLKIMITINSILLSIAYYLSITIIKQDNILILHNKFLDIFINILLLFAIFTFIAGFISSFLAVFPKPSYWKINDDNIEFYLVDSYPKEYKNKLRNFSEINFYKCARFYEKLWLARMDTGLRKNKYLIRTRTLTLMGVTYLFIILIIFFIYSIIYR